MTKWLRVCTGHLSTDGNGEMVRYSRWATKVVTASDSNMQWFACSDPLHAPPGTRTQNLREWLIAIRVDCSAEDAIERLTESEEATT